MQPFPLKTMINATKDIAEKERWPIQELSLSPSPPRCSLIQSDSLKDNSRPTGQDTQASLTKAKFLPSSLCLLQGAV